MGRLPVRGSHRPAHAEVSSFCEVSSPYTEAIRAYRPAFARIVRSSSRSSADVAPLHRFVSEECIFSCQCACSSYMLHIHCSSDNSSCHGQKLTNHSSFFDEFGGFFGFQAQKRSPWVSLPTAIKKQTTIHLLQTSNGQTINPGWMICRSTWRDGLRSGRS